MKISSELLIKHLFHKFSINNYGEQILVLECDSCYETIARFDVGSVTELLKESEK